MVDNYPKSQQVEDALYKIGLAFYELHYCTDARTFLAETQKRFPKTHYAASIHKTDVFDLTNPTSPTCTCFIRPNTRTGPCSR